MLLWAALIAFGCKLRQCSSHPLQRADPFLDVSDLRFRPFSDVGARGAVTQPQVERLLYLAQGKAKLLRPAYKAIRRTDSLG